MTLGWRRAAVWAVGLFIALFVFRLIFDAKPEPSTFQPSSFQNQQPNDEGRKNYASTRKGAISPASPPTGDVQKYEKIATLSQLSAKFDQDRTALTAAITGNQGIVQVERAIGLAGRRSLFLGIGVPPEKFEAFVATAQAIGQSVQVDIVKNDKTNEYLQLKAKRTTLEKARTALEDLRTSGGSIDERVNVQSRLTDIEEKIQALGVSLGEFDTQNELCTVKLTLTERPAPRAQSLARRAMDALEWTALVYGAIAAGLLTLTIAGWLAVSLASHLMTLIRATRTP
jgi:Domain of unknown function (DUF4349)